MKNTIQLVLCILFGAMMIFSGLNKFFQFAPFPEDMPQAMKDAVDAFMTIGWLMPLVGLVEIIAGALIIIPKTRALGALMILPVMVGILLTNTITDTQGMPIALVMSAILAWVLIDNRQRYAGIVE